jgi:hypothetical protein
VAHGQSSPRRESTEVVARGRFRLISSSSTTKTPASTRSASSNVRARLRAFRHTSGPLCRNVGFRLVGEERLLRRDSARLSERNGRSG